MTHSILLKLSRLERMLDTKKARNAEISQLEEDLRKAKVRRG